MMNEQEFNALVSILARAPMTPGEILWVNALLDRIKPKPERNEQPRADLD